MTERDKQIGYLIKLITDLPKADCEACDMSEDFCLTCCYEYRLAEHLIAHGVIVPPCDIGDEIYYVIGKDKIYKSVCCAFSHDAFDNLIIIDEFYGCHTEERVFLTYEEAEAAVKEREQK